jgi:hypothetical protein
VSGLQATHTYKGTPYLCATLRELWPYYQTTDDSKKWFAFTPDMRRVTIGGVESEQRLKEIVDGSEAISDVIDQLTYQPGQ